MRNKIWIEPIGEALAAMEDYRKGWIIAKDAYGEYAKSRGADSYLSFYDSRPTGLVFNRYPKDLPAHFRHVSRGRHLGILRSTRAKATRDAVLAEQAVIDALPQVPDLWAILNRFGLPSVFSWKSESRKSEGCAHLDRWQPCWTSQNGRIFLRGEDPLKVAESYPESVGTFNFGDGTIPSGLFRKHHEHEVIYIQGEENLILEAA